MESLNESSKPPNNYRNLVKKFWESKNYCSLCCQFYLFKKTQITEAETESYEMNPVE